MGIFSSRERTYAFTAIQRMSEDADIIPSSKVAMLHYLAASANSPSVSVNDKSLAQYLMEYSQKSLPSRCRRAYRFAENGGYAYGLPTANEAVVAGINLSNKVKTFLDATTGHTVSMVYAYIGDPNYQHFMWKKLIEVYGYNPTTNELATFTNSKGFPCYLQTGKLIFGSQTVVSTESGEALQQYGYSTESGECLSRSQNLNAPVVTPDVNTNTPDAIAEVFYQYNEPIPDVTPPPIAVVNNLSTTTINGYAEKDSYLSVFVNGSYVTLIAASSTGYFTYTFGTALTTGDTVRLFVVDDASNVSDEVDTVVPYTNGSPVTLGTDKTITTITRTESFTFDFLDYIPSAIPVIPAEPDDTPTVVVGDDSYVPEYDYIQACYTYVDSGTTHIGYLTYAYGTNTIPELEDLFSTSVAAGQFYPRLYARVNRQNLANTLSPSSSEYKSSKQLARMLGLNWQDWSKTLHDSIEDINDVQQLFLTMAVPMNTSDAAIREYLYRYWLKTYNELTVDITTGALASINGKEGITLEVKDTAYAHYVSFSAITKHTVSGTIGSVGTYTSDYLNGYEAAIAAGYAPGTGVVQYATVMPTMYSAYHTYKYQNTESTYIEIRVYSAKSVHIFSGLSTTAIGEDGNLIIPLDRTATAYMTSKEKEILYAKSLHLFVNMVKIIKIKWYQRSGFKIVMNVVAVVIAVVTVGAGAPLSAYLVAIVQALVINVAINVAIKLLIKLGLPKEVAAVLVFIAVLKGSGISINNLADIAKLTTIQLLQTASLAFQISNKVIALNMQELQKEAEVFYTESQEKQAALKQAKDLLGGEVMDAELELLSSHLRNQVFIKLGEMPEDFLSRNPINVTQLSHALAENYVDIMLQPPSLADRLNQMKRGDDYGILV